MGSRKQPFLGMERSIIHYNHGAFVERRQKLIGKPEFKKAAVHRSAVLKWGKYLIRHFSGNNATSVVFSTIDPSEHLLASWCIPIFPIQVFVDAAFVHIGNLFWRYIFNFLLICGYFFLVLLLVASRLFFLVILYR